MTNITHLETDMHIVLLKTVQSTFGQTAAGCHTATRQELITSLPVDCAHHEPMRAFMEVARPYLIMTVGDGNWGVQIPMDPTPEGFVALVRLMELRGPADPHVGCEFEHHNLKLMTREEVEALEAEPLADLHMDPENLAYQRELLA